jgi:hypothetical protein
MKQPSHLRGGSSARRYGREPRVHYARNAYEGDDYSLCEKSLHGSWTDDPVDCKLCLKMASGDYQPGGVMRRLPPAS